MSFSSIDVIKLCCSVLAFLIAIIGHEIMHGYVAKYYGDDTASLEGRLSLNPIKHIDIIGSIILPLMLFVAQAPFLFGWAKPVPVAMDRILRNHGYIPAIYVSLAGIFYNLALALVVSVILRECGSLDIDDFFSSLCIFFLYQLVIYNVVLGIFNLWPIPPLDGSQALLFLSLKFGFENIVNFLAKIQNIGILLIFLILATPLSKIFFYPINFLLKFLLF